MQTQTIEFSTNQKATALWVKQSVTAEQMLTTLTIPHPRTLIILNGGTAKLAESLQQHLANAIQDGLACVVAEERITVITGGTDAGIFQLFGQGRARWGQNAPCIGVAVADLATWPGHAQGEAPLERHHSHFVLVEGQHWGDETVTMYALIKALAQHCPTITVFASGGEIAIHEMQANVAQGRRMIFLAGSGRATDAVLAARAGVPSEDARLQEIAEKGDIVAWSITEPPATLAALVRRLLGLNAEQAPSGKASSAQAINE